MTSARTEATKLAAGGVTPTASNGSSGEPGSEKIWYTDPETTLAQRFFAENPCAVRAGGNCCDQEIRRGAEVVLDLAAEIPRCS